MVKLLENTFRMINIGLVNEMAMMCDRMGINVWEVIDAAATKPFGFMPFYPGPGLGGHCIPIDPFYLSWKTKQAGIEARFIELAGYINGQMPHFVVDKVQNALNDAGKPVKGSRIQVMGVAYKRDIDDMRESPALDVMLLLQRRGGIVTYCDPHVPALKLEGLELAIGPAGIRGRGRLRGDRHRPHGFRLPRPAGTPALIVDARNALRGMVSGKIVRLSGLGLEASDCQVFGTFEAQSREIDSFQDLSKPLFLHHLAPPCPTTPGSEHETTQQFRPDPLLAGHAFSGTKPRQKGNSRPGVPHRGDAFGDGNRSNEGQIRPSRQIDDEGVDGRRRHSSRAIAVAHGWLRRGRSSSSGGRTCY